ncbi:MAG: L-2,4-diaminobutyrate decarboxylase [Candidatus Celerinatantimonas neptuna]|nr:MAG: L-2,4-diaminobutyrate decarboxylase [Candidatus Celerinatantimonas neptuna]
MSELAKVELFESQLSEIVEDFSYTHQQKLPSVEHYLLNRNNLDAYRQALHQGIKQVHQSVTNHEKPFTGVQPHELASLFESINLDKHLGSVSEVLSELDLLYLNDAVYFDQPRYVAHLNCPVVIPSILAELILSSINSSLDTWDQSAGGTLIEQSLLDWTCQKIGFAQPHDGDGVFTSGGTQSNLMALLLARETLCEQRWGHSVKHQGLPPEHHRLRIFTSQASHFSVQKSAAILGLGYDAVIPVAMDRYFRMDVQSLSEALAKSQQAGEIPLAIVGTAGTTDFGSIDPLDEIALLSQCYQCWFHVDAAYGCGLLVSPKHRHWLKGIELADSVTVDYHKSFFQPVSCGAFFAKNKHHLSAVTYHAEYLNPLSQRQEGTPNLVDKSLQTTRRFDALKLWLTLRVMGPKSIGEGFDRVLHLARQAYMLLLSHSDIQVLHRPQLSTLVFRFKPEEIDDESQLDRINVSIRKALARSGEAMIAATKVDGHQYLKFTLLNPSTTIRDIHQVVDGIRHHGLTLAHETLFTSTQEAVA